jgi:taurine dehydrogenase small subunit
MDHETVLRRAFDAYVRRDVDELMTYVTDDIEVIPAIGAIVEGRTFRGREGIEHFFASLQEMWRDFELELGDIRVEGDRILTLGTVHARAAESGVLFDERIASITEFRDGKISRWETFLGYEDALTLFRRDP